MTFDPRTNPFLPSAELQTTDTLPVMRTSVAALDMGRVEDHLAGALARDRYQGSTDPLGYLLQTRCLVDVAGELYATLAGLICFGQDPQAHFPRAVVDIGRYRGSATIATEVIHLEKNIGGTIFDQLARVEAYLWDHTQHGMTLRQDSLQRVELHEYPRVVIRELLVNMLAHRDYTNYLSTARVQLFEDRLELVSPGGLPAGVTVDNILTAQAARNPQILTVLYEAGYVEAFGQGLDTVVYTLKQEGLDPPLFQDTGVNFVATVFGRTFDQDDTAQLSEAQRTIVRLLRARGEAQPREIRELFPELTERSVQRAIRALIEQEVIEAVGGSRAIRYRLKE